MSTIPLIVSVLCALAAPQVDAQTLDGQVVTGSLVAIGSETLGMQTESGPKELPLSRLQQVTFTASNPVAPPASAVWVELVDGSLLVAVSYQATGKTVRIHTMGGGEATVPVRAVRAVRFKQQDQQQRTDWDRIRQGRARADRIVVRKSQRIDYLEGVLFDIDQRVVHFQLDGELMPVPIEKVEGIIYHHSGLQNQAAAVFRLADTHGSVIEGAQFSANDNGLLVRSPAGFEVRRAYDQIQQIDFSSGKVVYLSDLEPVAVEWTPFFAQGRSVSLLEAFYHPKKDRPLSHSRSTSDDGKLQLAVDDGQLARVQSYQRGIAIHSRTTMIYQLPENASQFRALAGIDARVRELGHVRLVFSGDGRELFSADIAGMAAPRELSINVKGLRRLEIYVDYGENQDIGDHLNLCNARIVK